MALQYVSQTDPAVADAMRQELARERDSVELIASENFTSPAVMEAVGVRDVLAKAIGTNNPHNVLRATMQGLISLRSADEVSELRGKKLEAKMWNEVLYLLFLQQRIHRSQQLSWSPYLYQQPEPLL